MSAQKHQEGRDHGLGTTSGRADTQSTLVEGTSGQVTPVAIQLHGGIRGCGLMSTGKCPISAGAQMSGHSLSVEALSRANRQRKKCLGSGRLQKGYACEPRTPTI